MCHHALSTLEVTSSFYTLLSTGPGTGCTLPGCLGDSAHQAWVHRARIAGAIVTSAVQVPPLSEVIVPVWVDGLTGGERWGVLESIADPGERG